MLYEFCSVEECNLMDLNVYDFAQEEFQAKEIADILDLDKPNTGNQSMMSQVHHDAFEEPWSVGYESQCSSLGMYGPDHIIPLNHPDAHPAAYTYGQEFGSQIHGIENQSYRVDSEDFSVCSQLNEYPSSRTTTEDYNFRFLCPRDDMIDLPWKRAHYSTNNVNIKTPEYFDNFDNYSQLHYSDVTQNDDANISNANNIPQNHNLLQWNQELTRRDSLPMPLTNTRNVLSIMETNDTSRSMVVDPPNNSYNVPCNPSQLGTRNIENIHPLQSAQRNLIKNEQDVSAKKNFVRIVLRRRNAVAIKESTETVERYKVVLPPALKTTESLYTFKTQKEDTQKEKMILVPEDNPERLPKSDVFPATKISDFICLFCKDIFVTRYSLITHMRSHRQPFCSICMIPYKSREQLRQHRNRLHGTPPAPEVTVVTSKYGRKRQVFCPLSLMTRRSINRRLTF